VNGRIWIPARGLEPAMNLLSRGDWRHWYSDHILLAQMARPRIEIMSDNPKPTDTSFTDDNILRLRGWTP
jgi:hypothetical protein